MAHLLVLAFIITHSVSKSCAIPGHDPQSPSLVAYNVVTDIMSPVLSAGQVVLLYDFEDASSESALLLGQRIIECTAFLGIPLEFCSHKEYFRRQNH